MDNRRLGRACVKSVNRLVSWKIAELAGAPSPRVPTSGVGGVRRYSVLLECLLQYAKGQSLLFAQIPLLFVRERLEQLLQLLDVAVEIVNTKFLVDLRQFDLIHLRD